LNLVTTDGTHLVAYRFRNHPTQQPPSLYCSTTAGITMNRKYPDHPDNKEHVPTTNNKPSDHGNHVIVASEPTTYKEKEWNLIEKNHCLTVETNGSVDVTEIKYEA
jgi:glutamine amidotransferase